MPELRSLTNGLPSRTNVCKTRDLRELVKKGALGRPASCAIRATI